MGHLIFIILHLVALFFFPWALIVTIPLHLIYAAVSSGKEAKPNAWTHVRCPDCKELIPKAARICKHCGCKLLPQG